MDEEEVEVENKKVYKKPRSVDNAAKARDVKNKAAAQRRRVLEEKIKAQLLADLEEKRKQKQDSSDEESEDEEVIIYKPTVRKYAKKVKVPEPIIEQPVTPDYQAEIKQLKDQLDAFNKQKMINSDMMSHVKNKILMF